MEKKLLSEIKRQLEIINTFDNSVVIENYIFEKFPEPTKTPKGDNDRFITKPEVVVAPNENPYDRDVEPGLWSDWAYNKMSTEYQKTPEFNMIKPGTGTRYDYDPEGGLGSSLRASNFKTTGFRKLDRPRGTVLGCKAITGIIIKEVEGGWSPFSYDLDDGFEWNWGTDEIGIVQAISAITNKKMYDCVYDKLRKKYPEIGIMQSILLWLQGQEYSVGSSVFDEFAEPYQKELDKEGYGWNKTKLKYYGAGVASLYQRSTNDKYLVQMEAHLLKFNDRERFEYEKNENTITGTMRGAIPPASREALHTTLALASLAATFGGSWPAVWTSFSLELLDSAIYLWIDRDKYGAGLALIFAFAGPIDEALAPFVKSGYLKKLLGKLAKKLPLNYTDNIVVNYVTRNIDKLNFLAKIGMLGKVITKGLKLIKNVLNFVKAIILICKKIGGKILNFLSKPLFMMSGSFLTWDGIAAILGICNSMPLKELSKSDRKILQLIGFVGPYIQPFTDPCKQEDALKIVKGMVSNQNERIIEMLNKIIETRAVFSEQVLSKVYIIDVALIQFVLTYFGFSYQFEKPKKTDKTTKLKEKEKVNLVSGGTYKWGYYDYMTQKNVEEFQKKYNLNSKDGIVGLEVAKKMKSLVEGLGTKIIPSYVEINYSKDERKNLEKKLMDELKKIESENKNKKQKVIEVIQDNREEIEKELMEEINNLDDYDESRMETIIKELDLELNKLA